LQPEAGFRSLGVAGMSLILDSSVALAWVYANETTDAILRVFDSVRVRGSRGYGGGRLPMFCN